MPSKSSSPTNDINDHHRRSIRLPKYDYAQPGAFYITIVTYQRLSLFGEIKNDQMTLNDMGLIAREQWFLSAKLRPYISLHEDEFVVMPTHTHGIIEILNRPPPTEIPHEDFGQPVAHSIPTIVRAYKSAVTYQINAAQYSKGAKVWQTNYYERVIRNEAERTKIGHYIRTNPENWLSDNEYANG